MSNSGALFKIASQWLIGILLTLVLIAFFLLVTAVQLTAEGTGQRLLRRGVAVTADIDTILPRLESDLHAAAQTSSAANVRVPNFPIPVDIPKERASRIEGAELRGLILDESARRLYDDGSSVWASGDDSATQSIQDVSTAGALHRGFGLVTNTWHNIFLAMAIVTGVTAALLAGVLLISLGSYMRLIALGAVTIAAAVPSLAAAVGVRFAMRTADTDADPFEKRLIDLGVDVSWIFIRNSLILSILGFAILAAGAFALWLRSRVSVAPASPYLDNAP